MAVWLLAHLEHTRLQSIEFAFLIVGHTHDLIDAVFAYVSRALHAQDVLSVPDMFTRLNAKMKRLPVWKHLRDVFGFRDSRPRDLTASAIKGVSLPHHYRVVWGQNGNICVQSKRWLTSADWTPPVILVRSSDVCKVRDWRAPLLPPSWPARFQNQALNWLEKLRGLLVQAQRDWSQLDHMERLIRDELPEYLPSGETLDAQVRRLRQHSAKTFPCVAGEAGTLPGLDSAAVAAFPGSSGGLQKQNT